MMTSKIALGFALLALTGTGCGTITSADQVTPDAGATGPDSGSSVDLGVAPDAVPACNQSCQNVADTWARYTGAVAVALTRENTYLAAVSAAQAEWSREFADNCAGHAAPCTSLDRDQFVAMDPAVIAAAAELDTYVQRRDAAYATYLSACAAAGQSPMPAIS